ncbi:hydroxymethylglutaryl-CoA lyase [Celeribacter marinus]|uniref:hydroxymethylglutaryl-CoA lyase n=1 Tax=Celeribacter marinus TaxID=1397108 RepID=UPI003171482C
MFDTSNDRIGGAILIEDEFLRDGLQNEKRVFSVEEKRAFLADIEAAGATRIQVGSFVHPDYVPQMANTDALCAAMPRREGVIYTALVLNQSGLDRALAVGLTHLSISASASETHSMKNTNRTVAEGRARISPVIEKALNSGVTVRAGIQSALGCGFEGKISPAVVMDMAREFSNMGVSEINIADTAGLANPRQVYEMCIALRAVVAPHVALSLHLHDTRGLGLANMLAGLQAGVRIFDAAMGGLGGCPFIPKATGNIATEDAAFLCGEMGYDTGINWDALRAPVQRAEALLGRTLPARVSHVPAPPWVHMSEAAQ